MKNLFCKLGYQWEMDDDGFWFEEYLSEVKVKEMLDHVDSFAKQEREAVRAEIADLITELNDISETEDIYFQPDIASKIKIRFKFVLNNLNRILESLKGDE